jgi:hypothetical protein
MIYNKDIFLKELANLPELKDNILSIVFALNPGIDISRKEKFFDNVLPFYKSQTGKERSKIEIVKSESEISIDKWTGRDLRIRNLRLKSVRGIPESDKPFGIDLTDEEGQPQSLIILGSNGAGKSSIYSSLEYCYCQSIGEAQLRTYRRIDEGSEEYKKFLEHFDNGFSRAYCKVQVAEGVMDIQKENIPRNVRRIINPETHFISDHDLYINGQLDYSSSGDHSFHNTIARSLGLEDLLEFEKNLKTFTIYRRVTESRNVTSLEKNNTSLESLIESNNKSIIEKNDRLTKLKSTQEEIPEEKGIKDALQKLNKINSSRILIAINYSTLLDGIKAYRQAYTEFISKRIQSSGFTELQFLNTGLELLKEASDCPFCFESKHDKSHIEFEVKERISKIKSLNEATQELNRTFNQLTESLESTLNQLLLLRSKVSEEITLIENDTTFNELSISENKFIAYLGKILGEDFLAQLSGINENTNYLKDKNKFLFDLIESHSDFIEKDLAVITETISLFPKKRTEIISQVEQILLNKTQGQTITEQVINITKEIEDLNSQIKEARRSIDNNTSEIIRIREQQVFLEKIKSEALEYLKIVHTVLNKEVEKAFAPIKLIVEEILQIFIDRDRRNVDLTISKEPESIDQETGEVLSEVITARVVKKNSESPPQSVNKYLNTFHYRLFLTMVGISIAIASRSKTRINIPLVLDDIFYASDFENRSTIEDFLRKVFVAFNTYTPELKLQLLLFTHDQLIFESAIKAVSENSIDNISFAKLFPYNEAKEEKDYLNLIYKLPKYLPRNIVRNTLTEA